MPTFLENFAEYKGNVVYIKDTLYVVTYVNPLKFFSDQRPEDCRINVNGKIYPLMFRGWRLCNDLKYRKRGEDELGFSGPHSAFIVSIQDKQRSLHLAPFQKPH